jgi:hypothetical protein
MKQAGHVAHMGRGELHTGFWWKKPDRKQPHGRHVWMDVKMGLQEIGWWEEVWTELVWLRTGTGS